MADFQRINKLQNFEQIKIGVSKKLLEKCLLIAEVVLNNLTKQARECTGSSENVKADFSGELSAYSAY